MRVVCSVFLDLVWVRITDRDGPVGRRNDSKIGVVDICCQFFRPRFHTQSVDDEEVSLF